MTDIAAHATTAKADLAFALSSHTLLLLGEIPDRAIPRCCSHPERTS
jgi:hypothetical protein